MGRMIWVCTALVAGGFLEGGRRAQQGVVDAADCTHSLGLSMCPRISAALCTVSTFEGSDCARSKTEMACACRLCGFAPIFQSEVEASGGDAVIIQAPEEQGETVDEAMDSIWIALGCMIVVALSLACCRQCKHVVFPKGNTYRGTPKGSPFPQSGGRSGVLGGRLGGA
mmetsp:Transcript_142561/g.318941  ORF Transcript_142561/g.318941 Transcript_142561/m.318941 type:complete len:169 (-) Transcript_142561:187-693(-)